ncbi:hypothetical protein ACIOU7_08025, partial [Pseudomonas fluorescens]
PDFQENDVIIMYINGSTLDGAPVAHDARQIIDKEPPLVVSVFLPNSAARELAKTQALFFYELERGGTVIQRSRGLFINIIGDPYRLAAPIAEDAVDGALKPDLEQVSIRIPHDDRFEEDMGIELKWLGTQADLITYDPQLDLHILSATDASNPLGFIIKVDGVRHLKLLKGGTLDLSYNLLSDENGVVVRRASQHAELLTVGEAQLELVPPIVQGEENGILEPDDLPDGTSKITCPNPLANPTKPQDVVTWQLRDANGAFLDEGSKTLNALTAGRPVDFPLDAAFVQKHFEARRGEKLSVSYNILRFETGKTSYSNPLVFVVGEVVEWVPPTIDSVKGLPSDIEIPDGGSTPDISLVFAGEGHAGQQIELLDEGVVIFTPIAVDAAGKWSHTLTAQALGDHKYSVKALYGGESESAAWVVTVTASDAPSITSARNSVGQLILRGGDTPDRTIVLYGNASNGQKIEILDNLIPVGEVYADSQTGDWSFTLMGLDASTHNFVAKALYGSEQPSAPYLIVIIETRDVCEIWLQPSTGGTGGVVPANGSILQFEDYRSMRLGFQIISFAKGEHVVTLSSPMSETLSYTVRIVNPGIREYGVWIFTINGPGVYTANFYGPTGQQLTAPYTVTFI